MNFLERDLEDLIFQTENNLLQQRGLCISGKKRRQLRIGNYGVCDLLTVERPYDIALFDPTLLINVWELKKDCIDVNTITQAARYVAGIENYLAKHHPALYDISKCKINLVGRYVEIKTDTCYLFDFIDRLSVYTYRYDFDGIRFSREYGYTLKDAGF